MKTYCMALYSQIEELSLTLAFQVQYTATVSEEAADGGNASHLGLQVEPGDIKA